MRVAVYATEGAYRGKHLAESFYHGLKRKSVPVELYHSFDHVRADVAVAYGWRNVAMFNAYRRAGGHFLYMDLGYWHRKPGRADGGRWNGYHKVVLDAWCPSETMKRGCSADRFKKLRLDVAKTPPNGDAIVVAGMSGKSALHHGFAYERWERTAIERLRALTDRPIVYRPKRSKTDRPSPIAGATFDPGEVDFEHVLRGAHAVVTHHSNAAVDAIQAAVPVYCEAGVGKLLSFKKIEDIEKPPHADLISRAQLLYDVAYSQWRPSEMASGACWDHFSRLIGCQSAS